MSHDPETPPARKPTASDSRQAERAAALRANLMRRKAQARGRIGTAKDDERPKPPAEA